MTPTKLVLRHYCQHEAFEAVFAQGMNSLSGANGSGKSNLLDALRLCLALESGNPGKMTDNIQDGHDRASLALEFEHIGQPGRITIQLKRNYAKNWDELSLEQEAARARVRARETDPTVEITDSWLKLATLNPKEQMTVELSWGGTTLTKVGEVRDWIRNNVGLDARVISESYFPRQGDVDGALSGDRETRQRVFHEKAGTALCQKLWEELGKEVRGLPDLTQVTDREHELAVKEARARAEHAEWAEKAQASRARLPNTAGLAEILTRFRLSNEETARRDQMLARRSELASLQAQQLAKREAIKQGGAALALRVQAQAEDTASLRASVDQQDALLLQQSARNDLISRHGVSLREESEAQKALAARQHPHPDGCTLAILAAQKALEAHEQARYFIEHFSSGECPTCHQEVEDALARVAALKDSLPVLQAAAAETASIRSSTEKATAAFERWHTQALGALTRAQATAAGLAEQLASTPEITGLLSTQELSRARETLALRASDSAQLQQLREQYVAADSGLSSTAARLSDLDVQILASKATDQPLLEEVKAAERVLGERAAAEQELRELETEAEVKSRYLKDVQRDLAAAKELARQAEPQARWRTILDQVRDLIHRDALPAEVVAWYADQLVRHTMTYLKMFDAEFELFVARDLTLMAMFVDKTLPVSRLSGGQKNMLNISMRLAMIDMFPSELRLLILDEVEVHLDQRNVARLPIVLERVKGLARGRELVVLFVSHHPSLSGVADHIIHIQ